jgi:predicted nuclease of predicted toxin-antitoxin system
MRLLLDTCVWGGARAAFTEAGHDCVWAGDWSSDPGDAEILETARREERVLVTLDKDFGELAVVQAQPHAGIVRLVELRGSQQVEACLSVLQKYHGELLSGAIVTVESWRVRIRSSRVT